MTHENSTNSSEKPDDRNLPPRISAAAVRGTFLGLAVGDALGTTLEFEKIFNPASYPALMDGPHREVTGGGPFKVAAGQVTDDTQMACCLASSLLAKRGFDLADIAGRYKEWRLNAFDVGRQTAAAIAIFNNINIPLDEVGRRIWLNSGKSAAGNGSLMRCAPIAIYWAGEPENVEAFVS